QEAYEYGRKWRRRESRPDVFRWAPGVQRQARGAEVPLEAHSRESLLCPVSRHASRGGGCRAAPGGGLATRGPPAPRFGSRIRKQLRKNSSGYHGSRDLQCTVNWFYNFGYQNIRVQ